MLTLPLFPGGLSASGQGAGREGVCLFAADVL